MSITKINSVTGYGRIASGKRINRAADDASGMAIANKLKANATASKVAGGNARQGMDAVKVADGSYDGIMDRLQSIRELAVKAMNGTNSLSDRQSIQDEINGHMAGIDETAKNTMYNQMRLMDGSYASMDLATNPTGTGNSIKLESARLDAIGISGFDVTSGNVDIDMIDQAMAKVSADRSSMGAQSNGLAARERISEVSYESLTAAQSRIEDLDVAKASTELKKEETLQDVQISMFKKEREQEEKQSSIVGMM